MYVCLLEHEILRLFRLAINLPWPEHVRNLVHSFDYISLMVPAEPLVAMWYKHGFLQGTLPGYNISGENLFMNSKATPLGACCALPGYYQFND